MNLARLFPLCLGLLGIAFTGCLDDLNDRQTLACPSQEVFEASVSPYMERRCGTLDCHGQPARPMRLYGQLGLREPNDTNVSGGAATTPTERTLNYQAVCNVEPEGMAEVVADQGNSAEDLLLIRKARALERHKGGKVVNQTDAADRCLVGWLANLPAEDVAKDCEAAVGQLQ